MRTFHTGGVAHRAAVENEIRNSQAGRVAYLDLSPVEIPDGQDGQKKRIVALKRNGEIAILDEKGRELERYRVPYGAEILVKDGKKIAAHTPLVTWDAHLTPILSEVEGFIRFQDIAEGETVRAEKERASSRFVVIEHKGEKHPQIIIEDREGRVMDYHYLPVKARIEVTEGQEVKRGMLLARQPRAMIGTQDITGGLPRVTEIFEARKPKEPAVMAEISGQVEIRRDKRRGKMTIIVRNESGMEKEHHVPQDKQLLVHAGDRAEAGDAVIEGPLVPHDILRIKGEEALQAYLLAEIQRVYRAQNVSINDKHLEIVLSRMLRKVKVEAPGDSRFLPGEVVDKFAFRAENVEVARSVRITDPGDTDFKPEEIVLKKRLAEVNEEVEEQGGEPAKGKRAKPAAATTMLLGITKASLSSESFISAASFQETTKVLTEAALAGREDPLLGLKENVILGHLIPAGTAFKPYLRMSVQHLGEPLPVPEEVPAEREAVPDEAQTAALLAGEVTSDVAVAETAPSGGGTEPAGQSASTPSEEQPANPGSPS